MLALSGAGVLKQLPGLLLVLLALVVLLLLLLLLLQATG